MSKTTPKVWKSPLYDKIPGLVYAGKTHVEIAEIVGISARQVNRVATMPEFTKRYGQFLKAHAEAEEVKIVKAIVSEGMKDDAKKTLAEHKTTLVKNMLALAQSARSESVRQSATAWCLEKFPEFISRNIQNLVQNIAYNPSSDEIKSLEQVTKDLKELAARGPQEANDPKNRLREVDTGANTDPA